MIVFLDDDQGVQPRGWGVVSRREVESFLRQFRTAMAFGRFHVRDLEKNIRALASLGLTVVEMKEILASLVPENYSSGPSPDDTDASKEVWVFGYRMERKEIYIKLRLSPGKGRGAFDQALVWSFHEAEFSMKFPLQGGAL